MVKLTATQDAVLINLCRKLFSKKVRFSDKQRVNFFKQLAVVLNSGMPILRGMELIEQRSQGFTAQVYKDISVRLCAGMPLAQAMASDKKLFPPLTLALVAAGEKSGDLNCVLSELAAYYTKQTELKEFLIKSALYPLFLLCSSLCVLIFFVLYVLPMLAEVYRSMGAVPTTALQMALSARELISVYGAELAATVILFSLWVIHKHRDVFNLACRLPLLRQLYLNVQEICFCKILALLLEHGINITEAVQTATAAVTDSQLRQALQKFHVSLLHDGDIGKATEKLRNVFSALTLELINLGTETGYLPQMLTEAANILEMDLKNRLEHLREILAPLLLLLAALIAGTVVCSVVAPLFDLFTALPDYK